MKTPSPLSAGPANLGGMKVHLRSNPDRLYYAGPKRWVGDISGAVDLESVKRASQLARDPQAAGAEVVLSFNGVRTRVVLPVWLAPSLSA